MKNYWIFPSTKISWRYWLLGCLPWQVTKQDLIIQDYHCITFSKFHLLPNQFSYYSPTICTQDQALLQSKLLSPTKSPPEKPSKFLLFPSAILVLLPLLLWKTIPLEKTLLRMHALESACYFQKVRRRNITRQVVFHTYGNYDFQCLKLKFCPSRTFGPCWREKEGRMNCLVELWKAIYNGWSTVLWK